VLVAATLREPIAPDVLQGRLEILQADVPVVGVRSDGRRWVAGPPPEPWLLDDSQLTGISIHDLGGPFDLSTEPPLRVALDRVGRRLALAALGSALDGAAVAAVLGMLTGGPLLPHLVADAADRHATGADPSPHEHRVVGVGLRVPDVRDVQTRHSQAGAPESFATADVWARHRAHDDMYPRGLADAVVGAMRERVPPRVPLSGLAVGLERSSLDATVTERVVVGAAPGGQPPSAAPRGRAAVIVSVLGPLTLPGVRRVEFWPAVDAAVLAGVGAVTVERGDAVITFRSRKLSASDLRAIATRTAALLDASVIGSARGAPVTTRPRRR
jgi:hypothetical protein